jgi:hypothetical protein
MPQDDYERIENEADEVLNTAFTKGTWFQVPYHYIRVLGADAGVMLAYLHNAKNSFVGKAEQGWFFRTHETIQRDLGFNRHKQDRIITVLAELGYLVTSIKGMPGRRHFRLCTKKIRALFTGKLEPPPPSQRPGNRLNRIDGKWQKSNGNGDG